MYNYIHVCPILGKIVSLINPYIDTKLEEKKRTVYSNLRSKTCSAESKLSECRCTTVHVVIKIYADESN